MTLGRGLLLLAVVGLLQGCGASLLRTPCDNPRISNAFAPSSYVVLVPYRYRGTVDATRDAVQHLNEILILQAMQSAAKLPHTHITVVEGAPEDPRCSIEPIYDAVAENRSGFFWRRLYHSAVFSWGEVYDGAGELLTGSHLRVLWNGSVDRAIRVTIAPARLGGSWAFQGDLPADTITFPLRRLTTATLEQLGDRIGALMEVRQERSLDALAWPLPRRFVTLAWRRPWLLVLGSDGRPGWIHMDAMDNVVVRVPEMLFMRSIVAYLDARVSGEPDERERVLGMIGEFRESVRESTASGLGDESGFRKPLALAAIMEGTLRLAQAERDHTTGGSEADSAAAARSRRFAWDEAQKHLEEASQRMPTSAEVLNLVAIAHLSACCAASPQPEPAALRRVQALFDRALLLETGNAKVIANLVQWHRYLAALPASSLPFDGAELPMRTEKALRMLQAWEQSAGH